ncbi:hypothetical protein HYT45_02295 [Candidatus Uhrbacteria bacterium]|nr:hypothetical protein [Candidatus Uhrbacteria bacterium]
MQQILIATKNPHKQKKLSEIVNDFFIPEIKNNLQSIEERGDNFLEIAENKAMEYSKIYNCLAIATDGGAVIPALKGKWDPIKTRRFAETDRKRIEQLLRMMGGVKNRTEEWYEAMAVADKGKMIFSAKARAMDSVIDKTFNPKFYQEGIWLCSITSFPQFGGRNFFELTDKEKTATEDSWNKLKKSFAEFMQKKTPSNR